MVKTLLTIVLPVATLLRHRRVPLFELAGAAAAIVGFVLWLGPAAGWLAVAVALLTKSLEWSTPVKADSETSSG